MMRLLGALAMAGLLTACGGGKRAGPDDPANPPRVGKWSKEVHLAGVTMNDASVTRAEVPFKLPADTTDTDACIEPKLRTAEEFNEAAGAESKCRMETIETDGADITGAGTCRFSEDAEASITGTTELRGTQGADRIEMLNTIKVNVKSADGQTNQIRTSYKTNWTRLSDCE